MEHKKNEEAFEDMEMRLDSETYKFLLEDEDEWWEKPRKDDWEAERLQPLLFCLPLYGKG